MFIKNSRVKHLANNSIFALLIMGVLGIFLLISGSAQDLILAAPGQAITDSITLSDQSMISITLPTFDPMELSPKTSPLTLGSKTPLIVSENGCSWNVIVSANNGGYLSQYDKANSAYVTGGRKLQNSMKISADGTNFMDLSAGGELISDKSNTYSTDIALRQDVTWQDEPLQNGDIYRMDISFVVSEQMCS